MDNRKLFDKWYTAQLDETRVTGDEDMLKYYERHRDKLYYGFTAACTVKDRYIEQLEVHIQVFQNAIHTRVNEEAAVDIEDTIDMVTKAMRVSWQLGQTYWQQADSDSVRQQNKAHETMDKFSRLIDDTIDSLRGTQ